MDRSLLVGLPTYDGASHNRLALIRFLRSCQIPVHFVEIRASILPNGFNILWVTALNHRPQFTDFLLWHADILPETENWIKVLFDERDRVRADVISAVVPIKSEQGVTSTALDTDPWAPRRYTLKEVADQPEPTWTDPKLLVNTGLMLVDFTKPWVENVHFEFQDRIVKKEDGKFKAQTAPEDWNFSRRCHELGVPIYATKSVIVKHRGVYDYPSDGVWGLEKDINA